MPQELKAALLVDAAASAATMQRGARLHAHEASRQPAGRVPRASTASSAERIHGNRSQAQRTEALAGFKSGKYRVLVATDIAARGIDVEALGHVVNFDVPAVPEDYIHRVGRTGARRADRRGVHVRVAGRRRRPARDRARDRQAAAARDACPTSTTTRKPTAKLEVPLARAHRRDPRPQGGRARAGRGQCGAAIGRTSAGRRRRPSAPHQRRPSPSRRAPGGRATAGPPFGGPRRRPRRTSPGGATRPRSRAKLRSVLCLVGRPARDRRTVPAPWRRFYMPATPVEFTLELTPRARFDVFDVRARSLRATATRSTHYPRALCCSFHTTAGYLDQSLAARLNQEPRRRHALHRRLPDDVSGRAPATSTTRSIAGRI